MCNLYSMRKSREELRGLFKVPHNRAVAIEPLPGIFPGYMAPIVRMAEDGECELTWLSWGFVRLEKNRAPKRVTNFRDDKITSPFWRDSSGRVALVRDQ